MAALIRELIDVGLEPASACTTRARGPVGRFTSGDNAVSRDHERELERAFTT